MSINPRTFALVLALIMCWSTVCLARNGPGAERLAPEMLGEMQSAAGVLDEIVTDDDPPSYAIVRLTSGRHAGRTVKARLPARMGAFLREGRRCIITVDEIAEGTFQAVVTGPLREGPLLALAAVLAVVLVVALGRKGLRAIAAMALSAAALLGCVVPLAIRGWPPVPVALAAGAAVCALGIPIIAGWKRASLAAVIGSLLALGAAALLPVCAASALSLTGLEVSLGTVFNQEAILWYSESLANVDFSGLLIAGIAIAGLGATMDIAVTVASAVSESAALSPDATRRALFGAGWSVGKDIFGVMVLTVTLAMVGTGLTKYLLFFISGTDDAFMRMLDYEELAAEVLTLAAATIAMALAVPITALISSRLSGARQSGKVADPKRTNLHLPLRGAIVVFSIAALVVTCVGTRLSQLTRYDAAPVRKAETVYGQRTSEQDVLARVSGMADPIEDIFDIPVMENLRRGSARPRHQPLALEILTGHQRGRLVMVDHILQFNPSQNALPRTGGTVRAHIEWGDRPGDDIDAVVFAPVIRSHWIIPGACAVLACAIIVFGVAGVKLAAALVAVGAAALLILFPMLVHGKSPTLTAALFAVIAAIPVLFVLGGHRRVKLWALCGAAGGLALGALATALGARVLSITGLATTDALYLKQALGGNLDFAGIATCGMIVCVVAAALDIAGSVSAAVWEVARTGNGAKRSDAVAAGLRISGNITGAMMLTLLFVWLGSKLPAIMIPIARGTPWRVFLNSETFALEILHLFGGSIALAVTGPLAALAAARLWRDPRAPDNAPAPRQARRGLTLAAATAGAALLASCVFAGRPLLSRISGAHAPLPWQRLNRLVDARAFDPLYAYARTDPPHATPIPLNDRGIALWSALAIDPSHVAARRELSEVYLRKHWNFLAFYEAGQALDIADDPEAWRIAGAALVRLGVVEDADQYVRWARARRSAAPGAPQSQIAPEKD